MAKFREASALALICFHSFAQKTPSSPDSAPELRVTVNVYNGINLPTDELSRAEREAERIFSYAEIHLTWTTGPLASDVNSDTPSETTNPPTLQLRIWPRSVAGNRLSSPDTLGFCLSFKNSDAVVLADAVKKHAVYGGASFADLLGLAMAHELGHLLLQSARHSAAGIMRARLTEKGLRDDDRGYLRFTADEAESIRTEVRRRMGVGSASK